MNVKVELVYIKRSNNQNTVLNVGHQQIILPQLSSGVYWLFGQNDQRQFRSKFVVH